MKTSISIVWLALVVLFVGCGPGSQPVETGRTPPAELVKLDLQGVVDGSALGSAEESVRSNLEALKATDAAKAEELLKDLEELVGLTGDSAKKKAEEMIGKL